MAYGSSSYDILSELIEKWETKKENAQNALSEIHEFRYELDNAEGDLENFISTADEKIDQLNDFLNGSDDDIEVSLNLDLSFDSND